MSGDGRERERYFVNRCIACGVQSQFPDAHPRLIDTETDEEVSCGGRIEQIEVVPATAQARERGWQEVIDAARDARYSNEFVGNLFRDALASGDQGEERPARYELVRCSPCTRPIGTSSARTPRP